ncbi:uncharacterized protein LOC143353012 [Halictus rubicundus]|uniref:uncharacterized protein LOC143353012 n=1 Tax=Halictus rubicundus TaxID=77578 RepID=UPI0040353468
MKGTCKSNEKRTSPREVEERALDEDGGRGKSLNDIPSGPSSATQRDDARSRVPFCTIDDVLQCYSRYDKLHMVSNFLKIFELLPKEFIIHRDIHVYIVRYAPLVHTVRCTDVSEGLIFAKKQLELILLRHNVERPCIMSFHGQQWRITSGKVKSQSSVDALQRKGHHRDRVPAMGLINRKSYGIVAGNGWD